MSYEVEQKYAVRNLAELESGLTQLNTTWGDTLSQRDAYYNHPGRDFAQTDEALRIRSSAGTTWITYKGPRIDLTTKTRREIDLPLAESATMQQAEQLLESLGFEFVAMVEKQRRCGSLNWQGQQIEIALDEVEGLGQFIEIEILAEETELQWAQQRVQQVATALKLSDGITAGYLDLLLKN